MPLQIAASVSMGCLPQVPMCFDVESDLKEAERPHELATDVKNVTPS